MRVCSGWEAEAGGEYLFLPARDSSFGIGRKKRKEKEAKRKERIIIFIIYKRYLKDYYIYNSCLCPFCCPYTCPRIAAKCWFYRGLTCPRTCGSTCPYPCPYPAAGCRFYLGFDLSIYMGICLGMFWGCLGDAWFYILLVYTIRYIYIIIIIIGVSLWRPRLEYIEAWYIVVRYIEVWCIKMRSEVAGYYPCVKAELNMRIILT